MANEGLSSSLQESLLTLISYFDVDKAKLVASVVTPELFETVYRDIATKVLEFRKRYDKAPGSSHIDDLFSYILDDPKNRQAVTYKRLLFGMYEQANNGFNVEYVSNQVFDFIRQQTLKSGVLRAAQRYQQGGENLANDVERILLDTIKIKTDIENPGVFLSDRNNVLKFLDKNENEFCTLGIKELDRRGICPTRKELLLFIAPPKRGKSWLMNHIVKRALLQRWKVALISLEMSEERVLQRIFQNLFAIAKRKESYYQTHLEFDDLNRMNGFTTEKVSPTLTLNDKDIRKFLLQKIDEWGSRFDNIVIKNFPSGSLTVPKLESYLDSLEVTHKFIPDLLIVDYPDLMKLNSNDYRISLGRIFVDIRGLLVQRNIAGVVPTQSGRGSHRATKVRSDDVSEDISKIYTSDSVITYSQTEDEYRLGLARLYVSNARNDEDRFTVLITQSYRTGQFILESAPMIGNYFSILKDKVGDLEEEEDE